MACKKYNKFSIKMTKERKSWRVEFRQVRTRYAFCRNYDSLDYLEEGVACEHRNVPFDWFSQSTMFKSITNKKNSINMI